jgi:hypothetical protein
MFLSQKPTTFAAKTDEIAAGLLIYATVEGTPVGRLHFTKHLEVLTDSTIDTVLWGNNATMEYGKHGELL